MPIEIKKKGVDELVKVSVNDTTTGFLEDKFTTQPGSGLFIDKLNPGANESLDIYIGKHFKDILSTGLLNGGVLSTGPSADKFSISDGDGILVDNSTDPATITPVAWTGLSDITVTNIATTIITFVSIDNVGAVIQRTNKPTNVQRRGEIFLGVIVHIDSATVNAVNNEQIITSQPVQQLRDLAFAVGFFNVSGNLFGDSGTDLTFDKSLGKIYATGSNYDIAGYLDPDVKTMSAITDVTFQYRTQDGTNRNPGANDELVIDPDIWDNAGSFDTVPNNKWTIQRIYQFISEDIKLQPGQQLYNSLAQAKTGLKEDTVVTEPSIEANGLLRGFIIVKKGATDLSDSSVGLFVEAERFGSIAGAGGTSVSDLQNAYDNSTDPEITLDTVRGAVSIIDNSTPLGTSLFEVQNNARTTDYFNVDASGANIIGTFNVSYSVGGTMAVFSNSDGVSANRIAIDSDANNSGFILQETGANKWSFASSSGNFTMFNEVSTTSAFFIAGADNNVSIGSTSSQAQLHITGDDTTENVLGIFAPAGQSTNILDITLGGTGTVAVVGPTGQGVFTSLRDLTLSVDGGIVYTSATGVHEQEAAFTYNDSTNTLTADNLITSGTTTFNTVAYTWPGADAAGALTSDGAGNLSWTAGGGATLQTAYDGGNSITIAGNLPVTIVDSATASTAGVLHITDNSANDILRIRTDASTTDHNFDFMFPETADINTKLINFADQDNSPVYTAEVTAVGEITHLFGGGSSLSASANIIVRSISAGGSNSFKLENTSGSGASNFEIINPISTAGKTECSITTSHNYYTFELDNDGSAHNLTFGEVVSGKFLAVNSSGVVDLGLTTARWNDGWIDTVYAQTAIYGDDTSGADLNIDSTSDPTKGEINFLSDTNVGANTHLVKQANGTAGGMIDLNDGSTGGRFEIKDNYLSPGFNTLSKSQYLTGYTSEFIANQTFFASAPSHVFQIANTVSGGTFIVRQSAGAACVTVDGASNLRIRAAAADGVGNISIFNTATAPTGTANQVTLYAEDVTASSELKVIDEAANVTVLSAHDIELIVESPLDRMNKTITDDNRFIGWDRQIDQAKAYRWLQRLVDETYPEEDIEERTFYYEQQQVSSDDWDTEELALKADHDLMVANWGFMLDANGNREQFEGADAKHPEHYDDDGNLLPSPSAYVLRPVPNKIASKV